MNNRKMEGFRPLKPGRIHFYCPICHRKQSNMRRDDYDPERAVVAEFVCPRHDEEGADITYWDADGNEVLIDLSGTP